MKLFLRDELPDQVSALVMAKTTKPDGVITVNDEVDIAYRYFADVLIPCVLWRGGYVEQVETIPSRKQDAGDIHEYHDIVRFARNGLKDEQTCRWVNTIHDQFVIRLLSKAYFGYLPREAIMLHRGMCDQAKFTAVRIWRAGHDAAKELLK